MSALVVIRRHPKNIRVVAPHRADSRERPAPTPSSGLSPEETRERALRRRARQIREETLAQFRAVGALLP